MLGITWLNRPQNYGVGLAAEGKGFIVQKEEYFQVLSLGHPQTTGYILLECEVALNWKISSIFDPSFQGIYSFGYKLRKAHRLRRCTEHDRSTLKAAM